MSTIVPAPADALSGWILTPGRAPVPTVAVAFEIDGGNATPIYYPPLPRGAKFARALPNGGVELDGQTFVNIESCAAAQREAA
ncbi:hypothetical protein [uncultured Thiohalocapsa sp.]|uniref:hypothetical protein n=1 Tax=uncultured Thiohalocapsa sp. TaxID=768990 RepID=UPI0025D1E127|nr:hypothetical protein [uncultured Thiohalocapsa sp.]